MSYELEGLRKICEIITQEPSDADWVLKILKKQNVLIKRFDAGCGRELFLIFKKSNEMLPSLERIEYA